MTITYFDDTIGAPFSLQQKASGRITESTSTPGPYFGTKITRFECRDDDNLTFAGTKANAKRCEFYLPSEVAGSYPDVTQWWAFTIVGVSGTIATGGHSMRFQWHGPNGTGQPQVVINTLGGKVNVRLWDAGTGAETNFNALNSSGAALTFTNNTPYHFLHRIVHSTSAATGRVEFWCNGVKFVDQFRKTIYTTVTDLRNYPKWGYYASNGGGTVVTAVDGIRRGTANETFATMVADFPVSSGYTGAGGGGSGGGTTAQITFLSPADNATITGRADWRADATDPTGIVSVAFKVDGTTVLTETTEPYGDTAGFWDSTTVADGSHTLTVTSTNGSGGTLSDSITVTVDNVADPPDPTDPGTDFKHRKTNLPKGTGTKTAGTKVQGGSGRITITQQEADTTSSTFGTTAILDSFTRANEGPPPSSSWTTGVVSTDGGLKIVSNECQGDTSTNNSGYWNVGTFGPDCECYVTLNNNGNDGSWMYLWIRVQGAGTTTPDGYALRFDSVASATDTLRLYRVTDNAFTQIGSTYSEELAVNDRIGIRCVGSTISAWKASQTGGWTNVIEATDATYGSAGRIGIYCRGGSHDLVNFGGGTL